MARTWDRSGRCQRAFPWLTLSYVALAVLLMFWPEASGQALYQRTAILHGQIWRLFTGHFVHFGVSHLGWNLAVVLMAGIWLECRWTGIARGFMVLVPVVIGLVLLTMEPRLEAYAGLSGVATGLIAILGLLLWRSKGSDRWLGMAMLGLIMIKSLGEWALNMPLFARFPDNEIRMEPLAHLAGIMAALLYFAGACQMKRGGPVGDSHEGE